MIETLQEVNEKIRNSDRKVFSLFKSPFIHEKDIKAFRLNAKLISYMIAITPRSGSSFLCDLLTKTKMHGKPDEWINASLMTSMLKARAANNVVQHLNNIQMLPHSKDAFGLKASYFQFAPMIETGLDKLMFNKFKMMTLFRKNLLRQAISLYIATETDVFHTNIQHGEDKLSKINTFPYDNLKLRNWISHIFEQELGWQRYLENRRYLTIYYEDFIDDIPGNMQRIAQFLDIELPFNIEPSESVFKKLGFDRSERLYNRFLGIQDNIDWLKMVGIGEDRYKE